MRDPRRIKRMLYLIRVYWEKHPDLRLCQMMSNAARMKGKEGDLFYVEDGLLEYALEQMLTEAGLG